MNNMPSLKAHLNELLIFVTEAREAKAIGLWSCGVLWSVSIHSIVHSPTTAVCAMWALGYALERTTAATDAITTSLNTNLQSMVCGVKRDNLVKKGLETELKTLLTAYHLILLIDVRYDLLVKLVWLFYIHTINE